MNKIIKNVLYVSLVSILASVSNASLIYSLNNLEPSPAVYEPSIFNYEFKTTTQNGKHTGDIVLNMNVSPIYASADNDSGVRFKFTNLSVTQATLARIYFEDNESINLSSADYNVYGSDGVSFSIGGSPGNLPDGNNLDPSFDTQLAFTANAPPPHRGVGNSEYLIIDFYGTEYDNVTSLINGEDIRVGGHVIGMPDGSSEAGIFVIPEPSTAALLLFAGLSLFGIRSRLV